MIYLHSVHFSHSVESDSLWSHGLYHARPPCTSPTPGVQPNSCPSSRWCHPAISFSVVPFCLQYSQHQGLFQWVSSSHQMAKVLEFQLQISPSNEYSGLISFRIEWFDLLSAQGTLKSFLQKPQFKSINSLALSFLCSPTLTSRHEYWKNHSFDQMDLCWQSNVSAF